MGNLLRIKCRDIDLDKSTLLYELKGDINTLKNDFEIAGGEWTFENGVITSFTERDNGGLIYSKKHYRGDILLDFYGRTVLPYTNDLNFTFCSNGWNYRKDEPKQGYIGGLQGWWIGKTGIEKTPYRHKLEALTSLVDFEPGKEYHIQTGRVKNTCFIFIDGKMAVELSDPHPFEKFGRVGLGSYASKIEFREFKVYKPFYTPFNTSYAELRKNEEDK